MHGDLRTLFSLHARARNSMKILNYNNESHRFVRPEIPSTTSEVKRVDTAQRSNFVKRTSLLPQQGVKLVGHLIHRIQNGGV